MENEDDDDDEYIGYRNVYAHPKHYGLTQIALIDYSSGSYEFDYRVVWKHKDGTFYTARDSGCSCPSPFETFYSLQALDKLSMDDLCAEISNEMKNDDNYSYGPSLDTCLKFLQDVEEAIKGKTKPVIDGYWACVNAEVKHG